MQNSRQSWVSKKTTPTMPEKNIVPPTPPVETASHEEAHFFAKKEPKLGRKPKASTYNAWAVFRERSARLAENTAEKHRLLDEARQGYQQALEGEPKNLQAISGLARVYTDMGKDERALETFARALKEHPKESALWFALGEHYKSRKDWAEASKSYYQAHKLDPENRRYMQWLGFALASAGQHDEAFTWLAKANGTATAHYNLAQFALQQGNEELSKRHLRSALEASPGHAEATALLQRVMTPTPNAVPAVSDNPTATASNLPPTPPAPPATTSATQSTPATTATTPAPLSSLPPAIPPVAQIGFTPESMPPTSQPPSSLPPGSSLPPPSSVSPSSVSTSSLPPSSLPPELPTP